MRDQPQMAKEQTDSRAYLNCRRVSYFFALSVLVSLLVGCKDPFEGQPHLPDDQLIANFQAHKPEFERLRLMILEDKGLTRVDVDWTQPNDPTTIGVTPERIAEYRRLFTQLGLARGFSAYRHDIEFLASCQGWVASGSSKGYLYKAKPPLTLEDNLDQYSSQERAVGYGYRKIEGSWYLYFEAD